MSMVVNPYALSSGVVTDPNFASVKLLVGFEGADGSTTVPDESSAAHGNASQFAQAQIDTADFKFGASSGLWDGTSDLFYWADHADWDLGAGSFTLECWIKPVNVTGTKFLIAQWNAAPNLAWAMFLTNANLCWNVSTTGSNNLAEIAAGTVTANVWTHVCVDYDGSKYRAYIGGSMVGSASTPRTIFNANQVMSLGGSGGFNFVHNGWMDEVRITKGVARYASDGGFTPPTAAFPRS